jgi:RIO kinase 1
MEKNQSEYELRKISEGVFDKSSILSIYKLFNAGHIDEMTGIISTGKEANVYHGFKPGGREIAIKIFLIEASDFRRMDIYIKGDRRFSAWKNKRQLVSNWAQKEYANLSRLTGKISCPEPIAIEKNVLVMGFIGADKKSAPKLKDLPPEDPQACLDKVIGYMKEIYRQGLVHGDLSEYNILNWNEEPYIIDLSMGMLLDHPMAEELLVRDVKNVLKYFKKLGVRKDARKRIISRMRIILI